MPLGSTVHIGNSDTLKSIYYAHFHFITKYGNLGGGASNSRKI